jgi:hypothetical protein
MQMMMVGWFKTKSMSFSGCWSDIFTLPEGSGT